MSKKNSQQRIEVSSDVNNDESMPADNFPLVFSGTNSGPLSLLEAGGKQTVPSKKKEQFLLGSQNEISDKSQGEGSGSRKITHQFSSGALEICHGTSNIGVGSANFQSVPRTNVAGNEFNYSVEQGAIKLNQPDSLALSDHISSNKSSSKQPAHHHSSKHDRGTFSYDIQEREVSRKIINQGKNILTPEGQLKSENQHGSRSLSQTHGKGSARLGTKSRGSRKESQTSFLNRSQTQGDHEKKNSEYDGESFQSYGEESSSMSAFKLTTLGRFEELNVLCKEYNLNYINITNEQGNNLIIKAVQNKDLEGIKVLIAAARAQLSEQGMPNQAVDAKIKEWINSKSNSGYTAAHFSCYIGDPDILMLLLSEGADFLQLNNEGSNGLHVAAQNDAIASIVFLLLLGIDINSKDLKDATPLHWASFQGLDQSVIFLLSFGAAVNERDSEGMTPLILSAISGSIRIVRMLLLAGADRTITDNKNRTALFMVEEDPENANEGVAEMLKRTSGFQEYWNIRPVFKPTKKSPQQVLCYLGMYIFAHVSFIFFNYTLWTDSSRDFIIGILLVLGVFTNISFFVSWLRDPGYVRHSDLAKRQSPLKNQELEKLFNKQQSIQSQDDLGERAALAQPPLNQEQRVKLFNLFELLKVESDSSKLCAHCSIFKPKRSRHCDICQECVSVYDHHCPWINNCVGTKNHVFFLVFIIFVWLSIIMLSLINILYSWRSDYPNHEYIDFIGIIPYSFKLGFMILKIVCAAATVFFSFLFGVPLTLLIIVQVGNFRRNCTTFERFSQAAKNSTAQAQQQQQSQQQESLISQSTPNEDSQLVQSLITSEQFGTSSSIANCYEMCIKNQQNQIFLFKKEP